MKSPFSGSYKNIFRATFIKGKKVGEEGEEGEGEGEENIIFRLLKTKLVKDVIVRVEARGKNVYVRTLNVCSNNSSYYQKNDERAV